jgi:hypothetical protein
MLQVWRLELVARMSGGRVDSLEDLAEIKGALRMLRTVETLPVHVQNQLDEFRQEETMKEKIDARQQRYI